MKKYKVKRCVTSVPKCILGEVGKLINVLDGHYLLQFDFKHHHLHDGMGSDIKGKPNQCWWLFENEIVGVK